METILTFIVATALAAAIVWQTTSPTRPETRTRRPRSRPHPRLSFRETFQTTGPPPRLDRGESAAGLPVFAAPENRPPTALSIVRLVLTIVLVTAAGITLMGGIGFVVWRIVTTYFEQT